MSDISPKWLMQDMINIVEMANETPSNEKYAPRSCYEKELEKWGDEAKRRIMELNNLARQKCPLERELEGALYKIKAFCWDYLRNHDSEKPKGVDQQDQSKDNPNDRMGLAFNESANDVLPDNPKDQGHD